MVKVKKLIHVTRGDINKGLKGCSDMCPIALALKRETGKVPTVLYTYAYLKQREKNGFDTRFPLPRSCTRFIVKFDSGRVKRSEMRPFRFWAEWEE